MLYKGVNSLRPSDGYIRVSRPYIIIWSDNVLSLGMRQAIIWANTARILSIRRTNFSQILSAILTFHSRASENVVCEIAANFSSASTCQCMRYHCYAQSRTPAVYVCMLTFTTEMSIRKLNQWWQGLLKHRRRNIMMTSSNGNIFRFTGHLCGESPASGEFPAQRPVTRSFDLCLNKRLRKHL